MFLLPLVKMYVMFTYGTTDKMVYRLIPMKANKILKEKLSAKLDRKSNQGMKTIVHIQGNLIWKWGRTKRGGYIAICILLGKPSKQRSLAICWKRFKRRWTALCANSFRRATLKNF